VPWVAGSWEQSAVGWTVWGSNTGGGKVFHACLDWPWGPPNLLYCGCWGLS